MTRIFLFCLFACFSFDAADAAVLHVIISVDETCNEGAGVANDVKLIRQELKTVAEATQLELRETVFSGKFFNARLVLSFLKSLKTQPDDVVVFFHTSHGFRINGMSEQWPALAFDDYSGLDFADIVGLFKGKDQRFALLLVDCCNNYIGEWGAPWIYHQDVADSWAWLWGLHGSTHFQVKNYCRLFLEQYGVVAAAACRPGQWAYEDERGSYFTCAFVSSLKTLSRRSGALSWEDVLKEASARTQACSSQWELIQEPIYFVECPQK